MGLILLMWLNTIYPFNLWHILQFALHIQKSTLCFLDLLKNNNLPLKLIKKFMNKLLSKETKLKM